MTWRTVKGDAELAAGGQPITLVLPGGRVAYRGALALRAPKPGKAKRVTVNRLPLESYLKGVVPRETFTSWSQAALESQAIAARTYAAFERAEPDSKVYQICDTTSCQVYGGFSAEYASTNTAIDATAGPGPARRGGQAGVHAVLLEQRRLHRGRVAALPGGQAGPVRRLVRQRQQLAGPCRSPPATSSASYPAIGTLTSIAVDTRDGNGEWGGRALDMTLTGTAGSVETTGEEFRLAVGLKSSWFTLRVS